MKGSTGYVDFETVSSENIDHVLRDCESSKVVYFDTETDSKGNAVFCQIYTESLGKTYIFDFREEFQVEKFKESYQKWSVAGHNIAYDIGVIYKMWGIYPTPVLDTFIMACSLQEDQKGLKPLVKSYFGFETADWELLFNDNQDYLTMNEDQWNYIANDPYFVYVLFEKYKSNGAWKFVERCHNIDMGCLLQYTLASVDGIIVDLDKYDQLVEEYSNSIENLQKELDEYAGWPVRVTSVKDVRKLLFEQMGLPLPPMSTSKGEPSTSKEALSFLPDKDGIISLITQIKESKHVLSSLLRQVVE